MANRALRDLQQGDVVRLKTIPDVRDLAKIREYMAQGAPADSGIAEMSDESFLEYIKLPKAGLYGMVYAVHGANGHVSGVDVLPIIPTPLSRNGGDYADHPRAYTVFDEEDKLELGLPKDNNHRMILWAATINGNFSGTLTDESGRVDVVGSLAGADDDLQYEIVGRVKSCRDISRFSSPEAQRLGAFGQRHQSRFLQQVGRSGGSKSEEIAAAERFSAARAREVAAQEQVEKARVKAEKAAERAARQALEKAQRQETKERIEILRGVAAGEFVLNSDAMSERNQLLALHLIEQEEQTLLELTDCFKCSAKCNTMRMWILNEDHPHVYAELLKLGFPQDVAREEDCIKFLDGLSEVQGARLVEAYAYDALGANPNIDPERILHIEGMSPKAALSTVSRNVKEQLDSFTAEVQRSTDAYVEAQRQQLKPAA